MNFNTFYYKIIKMPSILILDSDVNWRRGFANKINSKLSFPIVGCSPYDTSVCNENTIYVADRVMYNCISKIDFVILLLENDNMRDFMQDIFTNAIILYNPSDETLISHKLL